ncbi:uncharacterized protein LOC126669691 [Mercurialis annua]|uniref:uncharacterized protein LOC126669691 n=1 Tax=Mercurialis annua TaxID=3986 RepID=UPI00215E00DA|nr:uncharacterized protein LOC126669691 [Mercurialis annua]
MRLVLLWLTFMRSCGKSYNRSHIDATIIDRGPKLSDSDSINPIFAVTAKEVKSTMFSINGEKAPRPDGYSRLFFHRNWFFIGGDVIKAVHEFFFTRKLLSQVNATSLSIIPKIASASRRRIIDNVLLAHEQVHNYHNDKGMASCDIKVDLRKAYDTIEWDFLEEILLGLLFPRRFIDWIMILVKTPMYFVSINGSLYGYFKGGVGLRHGDPLSPTLFVIVMEYLSRFLVGVGNMNTFKFHRGCKSLKLNPICALLMIFSCFAMEM